MCNKDSKEFIEKVEGIIEKCISSLTNKENVDKIIMLIDELNNVYNKNITLIREEMLIKKIEKYYQQLIQNIYKSFSINRDYIKVLYKLAINLQSTRQTNLYIECYKKILDTQIDMNDAVQLRCKAAAAYCLKEDYISIKCFEKLLDFNINKISDLFDIGSKLRNMGQNNLSRKYFRKILYIEDSNDEDIYIKGIIAYYLNEDDIGEKCFDKLIQYKENTKDIIGIYNIIINLYYNNLDKFKKNNLIKKLIEKILDIGIDKVDNMKVLFYLGKMYREFQNWDGHVYEKYFERIIEIEPEKEEDYIYKGISCLLLITYNEIKKQENLNNSEKVKDYNKKAENNYWELVGKIAIDSEELRKKIFQYNTITPFLHDFLDKENNDDELYHYTSIDGLKGILEKQELWVTKSEFLNDPTENSYIIDIKWDFDSCKLDKKFLKEIKDDLKHIYSKKEENTKKDVYIFSMTTSEDNLPMWQNYSHSEGYNIKLNKNRLRERFSSLERKKYTSFLKSKVRYINRKGEEHINGEVNNKIIYNLIEKIYDSGKNENVDEELIKAVIVNHLRIMALFIKHPGFQYEDEYRFVFIPNFWDVNYNNMDFRTKENVLIPFIKVPINESDSDKNKTLVEKINMGPLCDKELCEKGIRDFLNLKNIKKYDSEDIDIDKSDIPLRNI